MTKVLKILNEIESAKGNEKLEILMSKKSNDVLKEVCRLAYSPTTQFYIKKVPDGWQHEESAPPNWEIVFEKLNKLSSREITGHKAIEYLTHGILSCCDHQIAEVVYRIIQKDLKCGIGASTINKVWKNLIVKPPRQGCKGCSKENWEKLRGKELAVEKKEDGAFMSFFGSFMTRSGQPVEITPLQEHLECGAFDGFALEGEVIFDLHKANRTDNGIVNKFVQGTASYEEMDQAYYSIWEAVLSKAYHPKGVDDRSNKTRRLVLEEMFEDYLSWCKDNNKPVKLKLIERDENVTIEEAYNKFVEYVKKGFEGAILKDMAAPWKDNDKPSWNVKMKRQDSADLLVVDYYEGTGKAKGSLGGLFLESSDGAIKTKCGSGLTDEDRKHYWKNPNEIVGKIVEIEYEQVTSDKKTLQKSVSFPIFQKVRLDKLEADSYNDILDKQKIKVEA